MIISFYTEGNLDLRSMYTFDKEGAYYYTYGVNWRAIAAFVVGFSLPFPGFIALLANKEIAVGATHLYDLGWILSITTGALSYYIFGTIWPLPQVDKNLPFEDEAQDLDLIIDDMKLFDDNVDLHEESELFEEKNIDVDVV